MEVITIESQVFKEIVSKIDTISKFILTFQKKENEDNLEGWVDSYDVYTTKEFNLLEFSYKIFHRTFLLTFLPESKKVADFSFVTFLFTEQKEK